jgi:alpha-D-xyloside xylohydrolase
VAEDGQPSYRLSQSFAGEPNEALYGLGQHQSGDDELQRTAGGTVTRFNTEVAIPFMVSSKNYGLLWDNYSVTKVGDTRDYEQLSSLRLY